MTLQHPAFGVSDLKGEGIEPRQVNGQAATVFTRGRLRDVLLLGAGNGSQEWTLVTRAYAQHHLPRYLPAFGAR